MTVILKETLKPNLIQTLEGQACFMHCGPFANIAHGNNSLVADKVGLKLGDIVHHRVAASRSDMGMEKFLDIVCRIGGLRPSAVVVVTTVRALKHHADDPDGGLDAVERGSANLAAPHRDRQGVRARAGRRRQPPARGHGRGVRARAQARARGYGAYGAELNEAYEKGGDGATALAEAVVGALRAAEQLLARSTRSNDPIATRSRRSRRGSTAPTGSSFLPAALEKIERYTKHGLDTVPICMAKTHLSLSHDPTL